MATEFDESKPSRDEDVLLLRATEVARLLGLSRSKVYEMMASHKLPVIRIGRAIRVPKHELQEWVIRRTSKVA